MRELTDIENEIADFEKQINSLVKQQNEVEMTLDVARRDYAKSIVSDATDEESGKHREAVTRLSIDFDAMRSAVEMVTEDLRKAQNEKSIILLYQGEGFRHSSNMSSTDECISTLNKDLPRLNNLILSVSDTIKNAVSGVENACSGLDTISKELDKDLSLEAFLDGHLSATGDEIREDVLNDIGEDLRHSIESLNIPENINLIDLQDSIASLVKWRALVCSFQEGSRLIKNPKRLFNPIRRLPSTQRVTAPTERMPTPPERPVVPTPRFDRNKPFLQPEPERRRSAF